MRVAGGTGPRRHRLPVQPDGLVDLDALQAALDDTVAIVAAMLVNNEIGVIQPVGEIARLAHDVGALMLCDAVQGLGRVEIPDGPDLVAVSAHKIHGPKGIGALWMREGAEPAPLIHGGGQERGMRSGTLSPALCVGFGAAAKLASERAFERPCACRALARCRARSRSGPTGPSTAAGPPLSRQSQHPPRRARRRAADRRPARHRFLARAGPAPADRAAEPCAARARARPIARRARRSGSGSAATRREEELVDALTRIDAAARAQQDIAA